MSAVAETTMQGAVNWFSAQRGYPFVVPDEGDAAPFAHIPTVERSGAARLNEGRRVAYELDCANRRRVCAVNLSSAAQAEA
jgi:cold shock protein